jgi:hypothetical protein
MYYSGLNSNVEAVEIRRLGVNLHEFQGNVLVQYRGTFVRYMFKLIIVEVLIGQ